MNFETQSLFFILFLVGWLITSEGLHAEWSLFTTGMCHNTERKLRLDQAQTCFPATVTHLI